MSLKKTFSDIYDTNFWGSEDSLSGAGSSLEQTAAIRNSLAYIFQAYGIGSVLDIPCGDYAWWPEIVSFGEHPIEECVSYIGADIVPQMIEQNRKGHPGVDFRLLDITIDELPKVDLIFARDILGHLSNWNVERALNSIRLSGSKYLMSTTYTDPKWPITGDIKDGQWRPINLSRQFGLGEPILLVSENLTILDGKYKDKSMGLWKI